MTGSGIWVVRRRNWQNHGSRISKLGFYCPFILQEIKQLLLSDFTSGNCHRSCFYNLGPRSPPTPRRVAVVLGHHNFEDRHQQQNPGKFRGQISPTLVL